MRSLVVSSRVAFLAALLLCPLVGCGGSGSESAAITPEEAKAQGMVWNAEGEFWEYPPQPQDDGYGSSYGSADDADDAGDSEETEGDDDDAVAESSSDEDGYANVGNSSPGYENYSSPGYGNTSANDYGSGDSIDRPADLSEQRREARERAADEDTVDAYASADRGSGGAFEEQIAPIFRSHCYDCHGGGPRASKADLELHTAQAVSGSGVIKANDPENSELFIRVSLSRGDENRMPPKGPGLSEDEIATLERWIQAGASYGVDPGGSGDDGYGRGYASAGGDVGPRDEDDDYDDYGDRQERRPPPKNLAEAASVSFQRGNDFEAMNQLFAESLVKSDVGQSVLDQYQWVPGLQRSKLAVRWGIGVKYAAKGGFAGAPRPAGVHQDLPGTDRDRDGSGADDVAVSDFQNRTLDYYTGDIGDELLLRLQNRVEANFYGDVLKQALAEQTSLANDGFGDDDFDTYDTGRGGGGGGGYGSGYGRGFGGGGSTSGRDSDKPDGELIEQIMPGVTMLGQASQSVLFDRASKQGVDLLVLFDVVADPNRRVRIVNTSTRVRLYDVTSKQQLAITGTIKNVELQRARAEDDADETIINEMNKIFEFADKRYKIREFPNVVNDKSKESVIEFVRTLIAQPAENPLWKFSEIRFYESRGLLKAAHAASAFDKIAPGYAAKLANVTDEKEMTKALAIWLAPSSDVTDEESDEDEDEDEPKRPRRTFR